MFSTTNKYMNQRAMKYYYEFGVNGLSIIEINYQNHWEINNG